MSSWKLIGIAAFLCIIFAVLVSLVPIRATTHLYLEAETIAAGSQDFKELSERFVDLANRKGAIYALEVLRIVELPPNTDLHLLGHVVGDELYKQKGVAGIADCTQEFRNACSHTIVIGALNEFGGEKALTLIRDACERAPGGLGAYTMCYHGLGHGVFAYYGYDLPKTVDFCRKTGTERYHDEEFTQCVGGAVMELMGGGGHDRDRWLAAREKYLDPQHPLWPCSSNVVPSEAKSYCYMYLTPRLLQLAGADLGHPDPMTFPKAFSFCDVLPRTEQRLRDACYGGFGKEFVPLAGARDIRNVDNFSNEAYDNVIIWCALSPAPDGRNACIQDALSSIFWGGENDPEASFRFCALVDNAAGQSACYAELASDVGRYLPERTDLCMRLPASHRGSCSEAAKSGADSFP